MQTNADLCGKFSVGHYPMLFWGPPHKFAFGRWDPKQDKDEIQLIDEWRTADHLLSYINKRIGRQVVLISSYCIICGFFLLHVLTKWQQHLFNLIVEIVHLKVKQRRKTSLLYSIANYKSDVNVQNNYFVNFLYKSYHGNCIHLQFLCQ